MNIFSLILGFLKSIIVDVFMAAQKTPAIEEAVDVQEGDAPAPGHDIYNGLYGMSDTGDQGKT